MMGTTSAIVDFTVMGLQEVKAAGGLHELSLLATLIKANATKASNFKLNLFGDTTQPVQTNDGESCMTDCLWSPLCRMLCSLWLPACYLYVTLCDLHVTCMLPLCTSCVT